MYYERGNSMIGNCRIPDRTKDEQSDMSPRVQVAELQEQDQISGLWNLQVVELEHICVQAARDWVRDSRDRHQRSSRRYQGYKRHRLPVRALLYLIYRGRPEPSHGAISFEEAIQIFIGGFDEYDAWLMTVAPVKFDQTRADWDQLHDKISELRAAIRQHLPHE